ncbi:hypothetical protein GCM10010123_45760 [Pilimelia anulata]|uniref:Uncharacterized protein n=1 Tax=Pilimelia anulata TaxID=53371 RepID=A0A8J3BFK7_9ACTN|nr:hypothetical protein [Pilimelia anulata]GGK10612.1 hypothetical protein GCM10010123_45760 [Pilimelia anulata]
MNAAAVTTYLAEVPPPPPAPQGWGKFVALLIVCGLFWVATKAHQRWQTLHASPSPTDEAVTQDRVNPQVTGPVDPLPAPTQKGPQKGAAGDRKRAALSAWVATNRDRMRPAALRREGSRRFGASDSTVKRAIYRPGPAGGCRPAGEDDQ